MKWLWLSISLTPDPAQFALQQSDHENAIHLGGEDNHFIVWNRPR